jgi:acetyl-CoA acetyltransferase family protein
LVKTAPPSTASPAPEQDAFATASVERAKAATASGAFAAEITPVTVKSRAGETVVSVDEGPGKVKLDKIASLKPAFKKDGTITAASSSSINDGAAALVMMRASTATKLGCKPLARIVGHATHAQEPEWFATAPLGATQKALAKAGWAVGDVDLWEINEAFAVVPMALMKELNLPHDKVNVNGGACALGHPIGASGRAHHGHADLRTAGARPEKGPGHAVHRRRRGHGRGGRAGLRATGAGRQRFWPRPGNASRTFPHRGTCWVVPGLLFI